MKNRGLLCIVCILGTFMLLAGTGPDSPGCRDRRAETGSREFEKAVFGYGHASAHRSHLAESDAG